MGAGEFIAVKSFPMPLADVVIRSAKPTTKALKLYDSGGLYLEVSPSGGKMVAAEIPLQRQRKQDFPRRIPRNDFEGSA